MGIRIENHASNDKSLKSNHESLNQKAQPCDKENGDFSRNCTAGRNELLGNQLHNNQQTRTTKLLAVCALLLATATWGSSYSIQKDIFERIEVFDFIGITFAIAGIFCAVAFWPQLRRASAQTWKHGIILGLIYTAAEEVQLVGLDHTPASVTGFLTGTYVVLTPVLVLILFRVRQSARIWVAVACALAGLAVMNLNGFSIGFGPALVLIGAVFYALDTIYIERYVRDGNLLALTTIQLLVMGGVTFIVALPGGISLPSASHFTSDWLIILYNSIIIGVGSLLLQMWAQKRMSATQASIVMTSDPIWGVFFAVLLLHETITLRIALGGALIIAAMLISQIKISRDGAARVA